MDSAKWTPTLRSKVVLAFVQEKKRGIRNETFNAEAWNRVVDDFNRLTELNFEKGQVVNQLSVIKQKVRSGKYNKLSGGLADPDSSLEFVGNGDPRLVDAVIDNTMISEEDWAIFYAEVKLTAGRPFVPAHRTAKSDDSPVKKKSKSSKADAVVLEAGGASSSSSHDLATNTEAADAEDYFSVIEMPHEASPVSTSKKQPNQSSSSSTAKSSAKKARTSEWIPAFQANSVKKEESKMETAMKIINKDFKELTGEEQLMVGLALTQSSYADLFLSLGDEGRRAFVSKFKE